MNWFSYIAAMGVGLVLVGCAHHERVRSDGEPQVIVVCVDGDVQRAGKYQLSQPLTVEHAIRQAGELDDFGAVENRMVVVLNKMGQKTYVPRKKYASFVLSEGDTVYVPRH